MKNKEIQKRIKEIEEEFENLSICKSWELDKDEFYFDIPAKKNRNFVKELLNIIKK